MIIKMRESKGFTLVELMIVVAIIGILAAVAVPYYQRYVAKSRLTSLVFPGVHAIENAISTKYAVTGSLAPAATGATLVGDPMAQDADLTYIKSITWTTGGTNQGFVEIVVTGTNAKFSALGSDDTSRTFRAVASANAGKMYWGYSGKLAEEFGLDK
jgi:type IV pilus assembly protein PilA